MTPEEKHLWYDFLKNLSITVKRQYVIGNYILDFFIPSANIAIELDGSQHYEESGLVKDKIRTQRLESRNLTIIRIPNNEVSNNFRGVCEYIDLFVKESLHQPDGWSPSL